MEPQAQLSDANEDIIGSASSADEIIGALARRGCSDLTSSIDWDGCSDFPIGGGGSCDVFKGALYDGSKVAIKALRIYDRSEAEGDSDSRKVLKRAARELYYWSKLRHSNVLPLMGLAVFRGNISMISPWMESGNLKLYLRQNPDANRVRLCAEICTGLCYIHASKMVHGDLKAANIMVAASGIAMISDFGNAQLNELTMRFTSTTNRGFSIRWTAPELLRQDSGPQVTEEADVYAYGMTTLEVLTGEVPYQGVPDHRVICLVAYEGKVPPRPNINMCDELWSLLNSCWTREPSGRPKMTSIKGSLQALSQLPSNTSTRDRDRPNGQERERGESGRAPLPGVGRQTRPGGPTDSLNSTNDSPATPTPLPRSPAHIARPPIPPRPSDVASAPSAPATEMITAELAPDPIAPATTASTTSVTPETSGAPAPPPGALAYPPTNIPLATVQSTPENGQTLTTRQLGERARRARERELQAQGLYTPKRRTSSSATQPDLAPYGQLAQPQTQATPVQADQGQGDVTMQSADEDGDDDGEGEPETDLVTPATTTPATGSAAPAVTPHPASHLIPPIAVLAPTSTPSRASLAQRARRERERQARLGGLTDSPSSATNGSPAAPTYVVPPASSQPIPFNAQQPPTLTRSQLAHRIRRAMEGIERAAKAANSDGWTPSLGAQEGGVSSAGEAVFAVAPPTNGTTTAFATTISQTNPGSRVGLGAVHVPQQLNRAQLAQLARRAGERQRRVAAAASHASGVPLPGDGEASTKER